MSMFRAVRRRIATIAAVVVMTGGGVVAATGVAHAEGPIILRTPVQITDDLGWAEIYSLGFTRNGVSWIGAVWDRCGVDGRGDGASPYLRGRARFGNGTWSGYTPWEGDASGCGDGGWAVGDNLQFAGRTITDLQFQFCKIKTGDIVECSSRTFDNPEVAG